MHGAVKFKRNILQRNSLCSKHVKYKAGWSWEYLVTFLFLVFKSSLIFKSGVTSNNLFVIITCSALVILSWYFRGLSHMHPYEGGSVRVLQVLGLYKLVIACEKVQLAVFLGLMRLPKGTS